ncbi:monovalent cation/H(+) antiporter subunit G [Oharaeibacter diazotrophicus]|uniref:Multicomponent Na+:H+ antiporter subunit G n=1 Tax=Oharaeibacter diazotrophicus TaxID=1920512 RepID=A0A4R6RAW1_9HYPH|nr:monovalent cation/H(+) antiporter subunit G [Oharaeibacter diazotrophicus]TDP83250.1 multicomponent Na+:H+ antiporter subunit G [Oharaeibacter diazotrophicus]BBE72083.1 Na(+)/H(+) antiporter subunit G [Pleomorphomonas sp. SM30]GLS78848.1 hypothetical protein GCM10007904_41850 [Oharaeibacter diazotrophicus]
MTDAAGYLAGLALLVGAGFALVGAIGVLRFPDALTRMHAASKAGALGSGFCLAAVALHGGAFDVATRAIAAIVFFLVTAPISAHLVARATLKAGYPAILGHDAMATNREDFPANEPSPGEDKAGG